MRNLWFRIGLGAAGVFVIGMLLITVAGEAKSAVKAALETALANTLQGAARAAAPSEMPFRLAGEQLGMIRRLAIARQSRGDIPDVNLEIELADAASLRALAHCDLVPEGNGDFSFERGFRCGSRGTRGLITVGEAVFVPGELTRPVKVEKQMETDLRRGDPFEATAEMGGEVRLVARGDKGAMVRVQADSNGAHIRVNDAMGRAVLRLLADSTGASFRVRGKDGREVVRMEAGEGGFALSIDTSASR
jgi:hypothetical protein